MQQDRVLLPARSGGARRSVRPVMDIGAIIKVAPCAALYCGTECSMPASGNKVFSRWCDLNETGSRSQDAIDLNELP